MQNAYLPLAFAASVLLTLSACQPKSSPSDQDSKPEDTAVSPSISKPTSSVQANKKQPTGLSAKVCLALNDTMQKVGNDSAIEAIYEVQNQLKSCLPTATSDQVLQLLTAYQAMYQRFLGTDIYMDDADFYPIAEAIEKDTALPKEALAALSPRVQYLSKLAKSTADVSILYIGEGMFEFHHDLMAMAKIFMPYLSEDQRVFVKRMAKDNQDIFWNDAAVNIPLTAVIDRAVFWEDFLKRYPKSHFHQDAKRLFDLYRYVIFFGSDNTQWTDDEVREFLDAEDQQAIETLRNRPDSLLAKDAQMLFEFMALSDANRQQTYPLPDVDDSGFEIPEWFKGRTQLRVALPLTSPWEARHFRDCMTGVVCVDTFNIDELSSSKAFAEACPSAAPGTMLITEDLEVWGFDTGFTDIEAQCEALNLKDWVSSSCRIGIDFYETPTINLYNARGWQKGIYENRKDCEKALSTHLEASDQRL